MKKTTIIIAGLTVFLAACSPQEETASRSEMDADPHAGHHMGPSEEAAKEKKQSAKEFADHFGAEACESSELIGTTRRTEPDGSGTYTRAYQASPGCAAELKDVFETRGFDEAEDGRYRNEAEGAAAERVTIRMADDGTRAGVEWEVETK